LENKKKIRNELKEEDAKGDSHGRGTEGSEIKYPSEGGEESKPRSRHKKKKKLNGVGEKMAYGDRKALKRGVPGKLKGSLEQAVRDRRARQLTNGGSKDGRL